jgi:GTP-dependent phosphoenolpyruvate carboxykinase
MLFFKKWISKLRELFAPSKKPVQENTEVEVVTLEPAIELPTVEAPVNEEPAKPKRKASSSPKKKATSKKATVTLDVSESTEGSTDTVTTASTKKKPNIKIVK